MTTLTIDEVMKKRKKHNFLVWCSDNGEPLEVIGSDQELLPEDITRCMNRLQTEWPCVRVAARFFKAAALTHTALHTLIKEASDTRKRISWYNHASVQPLTRLLEMLERGDYPSEVGAFHGAAHLVGALMCFRRSDLTIEMLGRLRALARGPEPSLMARLGRSIRVRRDPTRLEPLVPLEPAARRTLTIYLAFLDGDVETLKAMYARLDNKHTEMTMGDGIHLIQWLGELRVSESKVVTSLIGVVRRPGIFKPRYQAMIALGQIGPAAGSEAVEVIRAAIHDSSESVTELRERVCARILSPEGAWHTCQACDRGCVPAVSYDLQSSDLCPKCLGFAWVADDIPQV